MKNHRLLFVCGLIWLGASGLPALAADCIRPNDEVVNGVTLRAQPTTGSAKLGILPPGQALPLVASVPNWYETRTAGAQPAFVSKRWVVVGDCDQPPQPAQPAGGPSFTIDVFDVGTGLSVLVRGADFSVLYDAGSNDDFSAGTKNRVVAYLKAASPPINSLDHAILSHPHKDHVELFPDVLAQFPAQDIWDSGSRGNMTCGYWEFLLAVAASPSSRYHTATQGAGSESVSLNSTQCSSAQQRTVTLQHSDRIETTLITLGAGASMQFLYADGTSYTDDPNKNSLVIRFTLGNRHALFMGDAVGGPSNDLPTSAPKTGTAEAKLLQCCAQDLASDILIVGHHGSRTSSHQAFIDAVSASIFIVSSGPKPYNGTVLPRQEVLDLLASRGTLLRTDKDDAQCKTAPAKIGPDNDGQPGGCTAVRVTIPGAGPISASYMTTSD